MRLIITSVAVFLMLAITGCDELTRAAADDPFASVEGSWTAVNSFTIETDGKKAVVRDLRLQLTEHAIAGKVTRDVKGSWSATIEIDGQTKSLALVPISYGVHVCETSLPAGERVRIFLKASEAPEFAAFLIGDWKGKQLAFTQAKGAVMTEVALQKK